MLLNTLRTKDLSLDIYFFYGIQRQLIQAFVNHGQSISSDLYFFTGFLRTVELCLCKNVDACKPVLVIR